MATAGDTVHRGRVDPALVFALALAVRLGVVLASRGGPLGNTGYDAGVYYAAADSLLAGRMPYTDFVLLHPPGLMLLLTPFAALGRLTTDHTGFVTANTAFSALGAATAALVVVVARKLGLDRRAALLGGCFYAVWFGAVGAEIIARLEPAGSFLFTCGLLALVTGRTSGRALRFVLAGAAFGFAMSVKIWWTAPVLVLLVPLLLRGSTRRSAVAAFAGLAAALAAVDGVFFVHSPSAMWRMVVADQIGRHPPSLLGRLGRLPRIVGLPTAVLHPTPVLIVTALASAAGAVLLGRAAWRLPQCRVLVVAAGVQLAVLLAAPTYFSFYSALLATTASLLIAAAATPTPAAAGSARARRRRVAPVLLVVTGAAAFTGFAVFVSGDNMIAPFPGRALASRVSSVHCVMADSPMALIELDALTRDLRNGCLQWVDVSGRTYDVDAPPHSVYEPRTQNRRWQRDLRRYLLSGQAVVTIRAGTGISAGTRRGLAALPVLGREDGLVIHRVRPGASNG